MFPCTTFLCGILVDILMLNIRWHVLFRGQRIAEQIEREDPDQVARLRQQFGSGGPGSGAGGANFPDQSSNGNADGANDS